MTELTEREAREIASALRPNRKPLMLAFSVNLLLAVLLLGVPYVRGRHLASVEREHFGAFMRCMLGGEVAPTPGLSLPRGERDHYAARYLFAEPEWPLSCRPQLEALRPEDARFLWPSLKLAGMELRRAVDRVDGELMQLAERRKKAPARVPQRPLDALKLVQAASVLYARAADVTKNLDNDSVVLPASTHGLAAPARLPLMLGAQQSFDAWSEAGALEALGLDAHNLAYLRVENGKVERLRLRRNGFLRGFTRAGNEPFLVWAMPESRCADRDDHCIGRPTGLARLDKGATALGEPSWRWPGHPAGRIDRVLAVSSTGRIDLIARKATSFELQRLRLPSSAPGEQPPREPLWLDTTETFTLPLPTAEAAGASASTANAAPASAADGAPAPAANAAPATPANGVAAVGGGTGAAAAQAVMAWDGSSVVLVPGEPLTVLRASDVGGSIDAALLWAAQGGRTIALPAAAGGGAWAVACSTASTRFVAYGSLTELRVAALGASFDARTLTQQPADLVAPLDDAEPGRDHLRLICDENVARLLYSDRDHVLQQVSCTAESCAPAREVARDVAEFSAVQRREQTLLAFQAGPQAPTIKVLRIDEQGSPMGTPSIVGSCWEPLGGLCGTPTLVAAPERVVLLNRDGPDMLGLETVNGGGSFTSLSGFAVKTSFEDSTTSPLQQHRKRKGID